MTALAQGDLGTRNRLMQETSEIFAGYGVVMVAQISASQASQTL